MEQRRRYIAIVALSLGRLTMLLQALPVQIPAVSYQAWMDGRVLSLTAPVIPAPVAVYDQSVYDDGSTYG